MIRNLPTVTFIISLLLSFGCQSDDESLMNPNSPPETPTSGETILEIPEKLEDGWDVAHLSEVEIMEDIIATLIDTIKAGAFVNIHSLQIVRKGKLVLDEYFSETQLNETDNFLNRDNGTHYIASATKSMVSALIGIAIEENLISEAGQKVYELFPEYNEFENWSEDKESVNLEDALRMRTGWTCMDGNGIAQWWSASDMIKYMLDLPLATQPGSRFSYCSGVTNVLGAVIENVSNQSFAAFAKRHLFEPLGVDYEIEYFYHASGRPILGYGLFLKARDMAKFGQLYLNKGSWNNQQIVSADWIQKSTQIGNVYAYHWWRDTFNNYPCYFAQGNGGQFIFVFETLDLVVVTTGGNHNSSLTHQPKIMLEEYILPATK